MDITDLDGTPEDNETGPRRRKKRKRRLSDEEETVFNYMTGLYEKVKKTKTIDIAEDILTIENNEIVEENLPTLNSLSDNTLSLEPTFEVLKALASCPSDVASASTYICQSCQYQSTLQHDLLFHLYKIHLKNTCLLTFRCRTCQFFSLDEKEMFLHEKNGHDIPKSDSISLSQDTEIQVIVNEVHSITGISQDEEIPKYKCYDCNYETLDIGGLEEHSSEHADSKFRCSEHEKPQEKCLQCVYEKCLSTIDSPSEALTVYLDNGSEQTMFNSLSGGHKRCFKCFDCSYRTYIRCNLQKHSWKHRDSNYSCPIHPVLNLKCDMCYYMNCLRKLESKKLKCSTCNYETIIKVYFRNHMRSHRNQMQQRKKSMSSSQYREEVDSECSDAVLDEEGSSTAENPKGVVYSFNKCLHCSFVAKSQDLLKSHAVEHYKQDFKCSVHLDTNVDKCNSCEYAQILKEVRDKVFHCQKCAFKTLRKLTFSRHKLDKSCQKSIQAEGTSTSSGVRPISSSKGRERMDSDCSDAVLYVEGGSLARSTAEDFPGSTGNQHKIQRNNSIEAAPPNDNQQCESESNDEDMESQNQSQRQLNDKDHVSDFESKDAITLSSNELDYEDGPRVTSNIKLNYYKCFECNFTTNKRCHLRTHANEHNGSFKCVEHYGLKATCLKCIYQNCALTETNQTPLKGKSRQFKCFDCSYRTYRRGRLQIHSWKHRDSRYSCPIHPVINLKCDMCYYMNCLRKLKSKKLECSTCNYETIIKAYFRNHVRSWRHRKQMQQRKKSMSSSQYREEVDSECSDAVLDKEGSRTAERSKGVVYSFNKCLHCSFVAKSKDLLKSHAVEHYKQDFKCSVHLDTKVDKCNSCEYEQILKEVRDKVFHCQKCDFKTLRKLAFSRHKLDKSCQISIQPEGTSASPGIRPMPSTKGREGMDSDGSDAVVHVGGGSLARSTAEDFPGSTDNQHKIQRNSSIELAPPNDNQQCESGSHDEDMESLNRSQRQLNDEDHTSDFESKDAITLSSNELDYENGPHVTSNLELNSYKCFECDFTTNKRRHLRTHANEHDGSFKCVEHYGLNATCLKCIYQDCALPESYQTSLKGKSRQFKCFDCSYRTYIRCDLQRHSWKHRDSNYSCPIHPVLNLKCDMCYYTNCLRKLESKKLKCSTCSYETIHPFNFRRHLCFSINRNQMQSKKSISSKKSTKRVDSDEFSDTDMHEEGSRIAISTTQDMPGPSDNQPKTQRTRAKVEHSCFHCSFVANSRDLLKFHTVKHYKQEFNCTVHLNTNVDRCNGCEYEVILKELENEIFHCEECDFKTLREVTFLKHKRNCLKSVEIERTSDGAPIKPTFRCFDCDFQTWRKHYLQNHASEHESSRFECHEHSEIIDSCIKCVYKSCLLNLNQENVWRGLESDVSISNECNSEANLVEANHNMQTERLVELYSHQDTSQALGTKEEPADLSSSTSEVNTRIRNDDEGYVPENCHNSSSIESAPQSGNQHCEFKSNDENMGTQDRSQRQLNDKDHVSDFESKDAITLSSNELDYEDGPRVTSNLKLNYYKCFECDFTTNKRRHLRTHANGHDGSFKCVEHYGLKATCLKCIYQDCALPEINQTPLKGKSRQFKCFDCSYRTYIRCSLQKHSWKHRDSSYSCPIHPVLNLKCDMCYYTNCLRKLESKKLKCSTCNYETIIKVYFRNHMRSHRKQMQQRKKLMSSSHYREKVDSECSDAVLDEEGSSTAEKSKGVVYSFNKCLHCSFVAKSQDLLKSHAVEHYKQDFKCSVHLGAKVDRCNSCEYEQILKEVRDKVFHCQKCDFKTLRKLAFSRHKLNKSCQKSIQSEGTSASPGIRPMPSTKGREGMDSDGSDAVVHVEGGSLARSTAGDFPGSTDNQHNIQRNSSIESAPSNDNQQCESGSNDEDMETQNRSQRQLNDEDHVSDFESKDVITLSSNELDYENGPHVTSKLELNYYKCFECDFTTNKRCHLRTHANEHNGSFKCVEHYGLKATCLKCIYQNCALTESNQTSLKGKSRQFKCFDCSYRTYIRCDLQRHSWKHRDSNYSCPIHPVLNLKCDMCYYTNCLRKLESKKLKCSTCSYETIHPFNFKRHLCSSINRNQMQSKKSISSKKSTKRVDSDEFSDTDMHEEGSRIAISTTQDIPGPSDNLPKTQRTRAKVEHSCFHCSFVANSKDLLKFHAVKHYKQEFNCTAHLNTNVDRCNGCEYEVILKELENEVFHCEECDFKTLREVTFLKHKRNCRKSVEIERTSDSAPIKPTFRCFDCGFQTWRKHYLQNHASEHESSRFECHEHSEIIDSCIKCVYKSCLLNLNQENVRRGLESDVSISNECNSEANLVEANHNMQTERLVELYSHQDTSQALGTKEEPADLSSSTSEVNTRIRNDDEGYVPENCHKSSSIESAPQSGNQHCEFKSNDENMGTQDRSQRQLNDKDHVSNFESKDAITLSSNELDYEDGPRVTSNLKLNYYKCFQCDFTTNKMRHLRTHANEHDGSFKCVEHYGLKATCLKCIYQMCIN